jgi:hypothetical protein
MANSNEYMAEYMLKRYHERRDTALAFLGGKCVVCGVEENLHFHHTNEKEFTIAKFWSVSEKRFWDEISKCELRCEEHHKEVHHAENAHGMPHRYWQGCRCDKCIKAYNLYTNEKKKERRKLLLGSVT